MNKTTKKLPKTTKMVVKKQRDLTNITNVKKLSVNKIIKAIPKSGGNMTLIAKRCGVTRPAVYQFIDRLKDRDDIRFLINQERESLVDVGEAMLMKKVNDGDVGAIRFLLQTQGKARGYVLRSEVDARVASASVSFVVRGVDDSYPVLDDVQDDEG